MIAKAPSVAMTAPAILLIHHSCLSLTLSLKRKIVEVNVYHHNPAPTKTPLVVSSA